MGDEGELARLREEVQDLKRRMAAMERFMDLESPQVTEGEVHIVSYQGITCAYEGDADPAEVLAAGRRILAEERGELPFTEPPTGAG